jgi:hypothetical protein
MDERWEYKIVDVSADRGTGSGLPAHINEEFDKFGAESWELVGTEAIIRPRWFSGGQTVGIVAFFKRRVRG